MNKSPVTITPAMHESSPTIVFVEDNEVTVTFLGRLFARLNLRAIACPVGADTVACIRDQQPHLIILDISLGAVTGVDVLHQIRAEPTLAAVPIIFFSGDGDLLRQLLPDYRAYGATFVPKPDIARLQQAVQTLLAPPP